MFHVCLCRCLSVFCLSVYLSVQSICLLINLSFSLSGIQSSSLSVFSLSVCLYVSLSGCDFMSVYLYVSLSVLSVLLYVILSVIISILSFYLSVNLSAFEFIYMSVCL